MRREAMTPCAYKMKPERDMVTSVAGVLFLFILC